MIRSIFFGIATCLVAGCTADGPTEPLLAARGRGTWGPDVLAALAQVRKATARYHNIDAAIADGYTVWSPDPFAAGATCPSSPDGRMGYHLVNVSLRGGATTPQTGDPVLDPLRPEMLLYERRADGSLHLVGVEYLVFTAAWEAAHGAGAPAPTLFGQPVPSSSHSFVPGGPSIPHYELHVWVWSDNPRGLFDHWNPSVSC